jgi:hypothetical protein
LKSNGRYVVKNVEIRGKTESGLTYLFKKYLLLPMDCPVEEEKKGENVKGKRSRGKTKRK